MDKTKSIEQLLKEIDKELKNTKYTEQQDKLDTQAEIDQYDAEYGYFDIEG